MRATLSGTFGTEPISACHNFIAFFRRIRERTGLSQVWFARTFGFAIDALRNWEQGRRRPDPSARAFLTVIDREPEAVRRALSVEKIGPP